MAWTHCKTEGNLAQTTSLETVKKRKVRWLGHTARQKGTLHKQHLWRPLRRGRSDGLDTLQDRREPCTNNIVGDR